jgi:hypothetical protein
VKKKVCFGLHPSTQEKIPPHDMQLLSDITTRLLIIMATNWCTQIKIYFFLVYATIPFTWIVYSLTETKDSIFSLLKLGKISKQPSPLAAS